MARFFRECLCDDSFCRTVSSFVAFQLFETFFHSINLQNKVWSPGWRLSFCSPVTVCCVKIPVPC